MLAVASVDGLCILDQPSLKRPPSSFSSCLTLLSAPIASSWSPDNQTLFIGSADAVQRYDPESNSLIDIYSSTEPVASLVVKDKASIVFSAANKVHLLETATAKISQTFTVHQSPVNSLSLSNDGTLLASISADAAYVHNLTLSSHTALRGLPVSDQISITTCAFHPHIRTRLLLGLGKQLVLYDTSRLSVPFKVVSLNEATASGHITAIACSPFSKTLVAVATTGGTLGLVDLEKEKGLFRTINVKVPLASLSFSQEGGSIYLGTENGKLLILDLRALDKPPKSVVLSETGARMAVMSVQSKVKSVSDAPTKPTAAEKTSEPLSRKPSVTISSVTKPSPARRVASTSIKGKASAGASISAVKKPPGKDIDPVPVKKVFSPLRNPLGVSSEGNADPNKDDDFSLQIETLSAIPGMSSTSKKDIKSTPAKQTAERLRERTLAALSNSSSSRLRSGPPQSSPLSASASKLKPKAGDANPAAVPRRTRAVSSTSRTTVNPSPSSRSPPSSFSSASKKAKEDAGDPVPRRTRTVSSTAPMRPSKAEKLPSNTASNKATTAPATAAVSESISAVGLAPSREARSKKTTSSPNSTRAYLPPSRARTVSTSSMSASAKPVSSGSTNSGRSGTGTGAGARVSTSSGRTLSRTPELSDAEPELELEQVPVTPLPASKRRGVREIGGLGTSSPPSSLGLSSDEDEGEEQEEEVDAEVDAGKKKIGEEKGKVKAKGRTVLFRDHGGSSSEDEEEQNDEGESGKENKREPTTREESLSLQISPRRPGSIGGPSTSASGGWGNSPVRHSQSSHSHKPYPYPYGAYPNIPGSPGLSGGPSPQDFLRNIVRDAMYDFHQESRAEMMGLHLDLVRMGRGWRKELREAVGSLGSELEVLREENRKLREENEMLRRGY
ncbi:hypothetical protein GYMLUDRAFT_85986 [Collybiopsis luxurians FD-317 M1]|uniref:WD40 repeat-like protein n=1 Tax=Collybiopsis luxurians FD-317 M1 TaxID=944289 RepID=A0A0D0CLD9_9AGAR|nr:hypothetical protein GYMLUDRAFT_85986 [Collybiopsis luxurians FD-317 M1]